MTSRVITALGLLATAALVAACGGGGSSSGTVTLNWWAGNQPGGSFQKAAAYCSQQSKGEYDIKVNLLGTDADTQRQSLVRRLAAGDSSIDLMAMDVVWTAEFAEAKWILPFPAAQAQELKRDRLAGPLKTATYQNRLYAAPGNSNTQLLWYRKSQVKGAVPTTWSQLISEAVKLKTTIAYTNAQYEGTTVWFNSVIQSAGGSILNSKGGVGLGAPGLKAIDIMHQLASSPAANPTLPAAKEDQARQAFEVPTGTAFEINYPFVYASAQSNTTVPTLKDDIAWAPYPSVQEGGSAKAPIGGFNWGVGSHTKHAKQAFDAATCLSSEQPERLYAQLDSLPPTLAKVYDDPKFKKSYPFADLVRKQIDDAGVRPVTPLYADVSLAVYTTLSPASKADPEPALSKLTQRLHNALDSKGLL
ncbi:MAG TPA: extracellular solute-binding protein [Baekduia sp.]|uniref:extracellular solute-binding protein n=1 Tax=Baekduia sp. TaxID=2600305 RepID=UPI002CD9D073|nr:extracellular solute-binding protein [Baekduia sp.]HMJ34857.1 extracellular solute-binding protein [Baekduia sp.]